MDHFSPEEWIDFVRGLSPESHRHVMQAHLDRGCDGCLGQSKSWQFTVEFARKEGGNRPPDDAVRAVKAAALDFHPGGWIAEVAQFARCMFDSFRGPLPAMVRSSNEPIRQLIHEAEPFVIDLRLEADHVRKRISLLGQILNSKNPERMPSGVDVVLLSGEAVLKKASANNSGEFNLEFGEERDLQLFLNIRGQRAIGIDLPDLAA